MSGAFFNLYEDAGNVISDNSSEDEEIDSLMNAAVSSLKADKVERFECAKPVKCSIPQAKAIKKRILKERLRLKKKYIKWANKSHRRERFMTYFQSVQSSLKKQQVNKNENALNTSMHTEDDEENDDHRTKENIFKNSTSYIPTETIDLDDTDFEDDNMSEDIKNNDDNDDDDDDADADDKDDDAKDDDDKDDDDKDDDDKDDDDKDDDDKDDDDINSQGKHSRGILHTHMYNKDEGTIDNKREVLVNQERKAADMNTSVACNYDNSSQGNTHKNIENAIQIEDNRFIKETTIQNSMKTSPQIIAKEISTTNEVINNIIDETKAAEKNDMNESKREQEKQQKNSDSNDINMDMFFDDELNRMYPKFDQIISEHVHSQQTLQSIKEKIEIITNDVGNLNRQLEAKENEYNRLLYNKRIKEEILIRMLRKLKFLSMKKTPLTGKKYDLMALRAIEDAITKYTPQSFTTNQKSQSKELTAGEMLEKRANMTKKELDIERAAALYRMDKLPSDLYAEENQDSKKSSRAMPKKLEKHENHSNIMNQYADSSQQSLMYLDGLTQDCFQEETLIRNGHIFNRMVYQPNCYNESIDMELEVPAFSSTVEKLLAKSSSMQLQREYNHEKNAHEIVNCGVNQEAISVVPVFKEIKCNSQAAGSKREQQLDRLESPLIKVCQNCGTHEARFLCAACQNQWYCSRNCQVNAWQNHCESCD